MSKSNMPGRKVTVGALAGATTVIAVWLLGMAGIDMPAEVAAAVTVIISFGLSYAVPESEPIG